MGIKTLPAVLFPPPSLVLKAECPAFGIDHGTRSRRDAPGTNPGMSKVDVLETLLDLELAIPITLLFVGSVLN